MFTGIVIDTARLLLKEKNLFTFSAKRKILQDLKIGSSVSLNGVCLTVIKKTAKSFSIEIMSETLRKTNLGNLKTGPGRAGEEVNLEFAMKTNSRFEGHIVQGHIDAVGKIIDIKKEKYGWMFTFSAPEDLMKYIVEKGSAAINGISLTVVDVKGNEFSIGIIPHTMKKTMLKNAKVGDKINIETDILAKYLGKLI